MKQNWSVAEGLDSAGFTVKLIQLTAKSIVKLCVCVCVCVCVLNGIMMNFIFGAGVHNTAICEGRIVGPRVVGRAWLSFI